MTQFRDNDLLQRTLARQGGRITWAQLRACGVPASTIATWTHQRRLIPRRRHVYAYGFVATTVEARLWEAVLYAGPDAMLSHLTAAQLQGLIRYAPATIQVSTPRKIAPATGLEIHGRRRDLTRVIEGGVPVTTPAQTMLDLAALRPDLLPRALGQLDYQRRLDPADLEAVAASGRAGCRALREALQRYDPAYAELNGDFEIDFYERCREWGIEPLPVPNVELAPGLTVDAFWPEHRLVVELDGTDNHRTSAQLLRDADRELRCRQLGLATVRYRRGQFARPAALRADLVAQLSARSPGPVARAHPGLPS